MLASAYVVDLTDIASISVLNIFNCHSRAHYTCLSTFLVGMSEIFFGVGDNGNGVGTWKNKDKPLFLSVHIQILEKIPPIMLMITW